MRRTTSTKARNGFILQEVIVGIVIFGIAMIPIVRGLRLAATLASSVGEQARGRAWRSALEQSVANGTDPYTMEVLKVVAVRTESLNGKVNERSMPARVGAAQITVLHQEFAGFAEVRSVSAGIRIGRSQLPAQPRMDPLPPLPPIKMVRPALSPANGSFIPIAEFTAPSVSGPAARADLTATADPSTVVKLEKDSPIHETLSGIGGVTTTLNAVEAASAVRGKTWAEYRGSEKDLSVELGDGRTEWFVDVDGRTQIFEPSDAVAFVYGVDIGRPAFALAGREYSSGANVAVDIGIAEKVANQLADAELTFPSEVRAKFGTSWSSLAPSFTWKFGESGAVFHSAIARAVFTPEMRPFWSEVQNVAATPVSSLPGLRLLAGSWNFQRVALELSPPEREGDFYFETTDALGYLDFSAPVFEAVKRRIGRPQMGAIESTGETLSVLIVP